MSDEQIESIVGNKLAEIGEFLQMIDEFQSADCPGIGPGSQFVAGFGKHMALSFKQYIEENRALLADPVVVDDVKTATG